MWNISRENNRRPQVHMPAHLNTEVYTASQILNLTFPLEMLEERSWSRSLHKCHRRAPRSRSWSRASHSPRRKWATNQSHRGKDRQPKSWADRISNDEQEEMDFSNVEWSNSDTEQQESKLVEVKCTRRVQNSVRLQTRGKYPP